MKRRDFLKRAFGVSAGATIVPAVIKAKPKYSCSTSASVNPSAAPTVEPSGCPSSPSSSPSTVISKTKIYVDDEFVGYFGRALTDTEANAFLDKYSNNDVTFYEFGWRKY